jgi:ribosomal protein S18 acetylase RimI-like enzyme
MTLTGDRAGMAVRGLVSALAEVAAAAFMAPPWNETPAHATWLVTRMLADARGPGFALALAFTGGGTSLAGFGYGLQRRPAPAGYAGDLGSSPEPFEFCELAIRPAARGVGAGRALHDAVVEASGPQSRWLVTHPAARPAVGLYQASGWQVRRVFASRADSGSRLLMTRHQ